MTARLLIACLLAALLCTATAASAQAEDLTPAKQADIKLLIESSGGLTMGKQMGTIMTRQLIEMLRKTRPDIPVRALAAIEKEVIGVIEESLDAPGGLVESLIPLYANAFTHQDIREMLAFYQSPVGKKAVAAMPQLARDSQKLGEAYARQMAPEIRRRITAALEKEGISLDKKP